MTEPKNPDQMLTYLDELTVRVAQVERTMEMTGIVPKDDESFPQAIRRHMEEHPDIALAAMAQAREMADEVVSCPMTESGWVYDPASLTEARPLFTPPQDRWLAHIWLLSKVDTYNAGIWHQNMFVESMAQEGFNQAVWWSTNQAFIDLRRMIEHIADYCRHFRPASEPVHAETLA